MYLEDFLRRLLIFALIAAFIVMGCFYVSERRENARLYDVTKRAQQLTRDCLGQQRSQVDNLAAEINAALFLHRTPPTERRVDQ